MPDETRLVGTLPNLSLEILHRQDPEAGAEHLFLHLTATPSLPEALASPFALMAVMTQAMLAPWAAAAQAMPRGWLFPWAAWPTLPGGPARPGDGPR